MVVAGHDRDAIALMVFVNVAHAQRVASADNADRATLARHPAVREHIARGIAQHNARAGGTSLRIARSIILTDAPNRDEGELTDKGTVNQRRALALRADAIARLYAEPPDAEIAIHIADAVYGGGVAGGGVGGNGVSGAVQVRPSA